MSTDDEDKGHSINNNFRMVVLRADDESDLEVDRQEPLGSAANPIEVGDADGGAAGDGVVGGGATGAVAGDGDAGAAAGDKRERPTTSVS